MDRSFRLVAVALLAGLVLAVHAAYFNHVVDDAYISFRYLRNGLAGHGLVFNPGERVEGYTNFLWIVVLAPAAALGVSLPQAAAVLGVICMGAALAVRWTLAARETDGPQAPAWESVLLLAVWGPVAYWAAGGLETGLFCWLLVLLVRYAPDGTVRRATAAGLCAALLCMTRPDGIVYVVAVTLWLLFGGGPPADRRARRVAAGAMIGMFLIVYAPYFLWRWTYYDSLLPNTFYAKVGGGPAIPRGLMYVAQFIALSGMGAVATVCGVLAVRRRETRGPAGRAKGAEADTGLAPASPWRAGTGGYSDGVAGGVGALVALCTLAGLAFVIAVGGDQLVMFRFMVPVVVLAFPSLWLRATRGLTSSRARMIAVSVAALCVVIPTFVGPMRARVFGSERPADRDRAVIGRWLRESHPPDTLVALVPAGILPYEAGLPTLDLVGLNDRHIARAPVPDMGRGAPGHERYDADYVMERAPDVIFLGACRLWDRALSPDDLAAYVQNYARFVPAVGAVFAHPEFQRRYAPRAVPIDGKFAHVWVRASEGGGGS